MVDNGIALKLERYKTVDDDIDRVYAEVEYILDKNMFIEDKAIGATTYSGMPHGSDVTNKVESIAIQLCSPQISRLSTLKDYLQELYDLKKDVEAGLKQLDSIERRIIDLRYMEGRDMDYIVSKVNYTRQGTYKILNRALSKFI